MEYLNQVTVLAALSVVAVQQLLKSRLVPLYFANRYPVWTNVALSLAASIYVSVTEQIRVPNDLADWVQLVVTVVVLAAITYNSTIKNEPSIRATESE